MASQKSTNVGAALAPKRQRGRDRVAAILAAATDLFARKDYEAVTMTEVAAASGTAIGSLYRFFPTKAALAEALVEQYGAHLIADVDAILGRAAKVSNTALADALVDMGGGLDAERAAALALVDALADGSELRAGLRAAIRERLASLLAARSGRPAATLTVQAFVLHNLVKLARGLPAVADPASAEACGREARRAVRLYLDDLSSGAAG